MSTELSKKEPGQIATLTHGAMVTGGTVKIEPSRLALFQGTVEEEQKYGKELRRGDFFDTLESRKIGTSVKVMPITGWKAWSKWIKGEKLPVYSHRDITKVPAEDLEWIDDQRPAAQESVNMIVLVEGEPWPYLFVFKSTGLKAYKRVVEPMESRRGLMEKGPALYELSTVDDKNADGQPYKRLVAKVLGDPPEGMKASAYKIFQQIDAIKAKAERLSDDGAAAGEDDGIPI